MQLVELLQMAASGGDQKRGHREQRARTDIATALGCSSVWVPAPLIISLPHRPVAGAADGADGGNAISERRGGEAWREAQPMRRSGRLARRRRRPRTRQREGAGGETSRSAGRDAERSRKRTTNVGTRATQANTAAIRVIAAILHYCADIPTHEGLFFTQKLREIG
jgi:hypothetical protein